MRDDVSTYDYPTCSQCVPSSTSKSTDFSKAPRLAAILARTATKTRKPFNFARRPSNIAHDYRPSSTASFLARLETYELNTYSNKPPEIDAVAASKCGWVNDGKDRLKCGLCDASWVVVGREKMNKDAGKQATSVWPVNAG